MGPQLLTSAGWAPAAGRPDSALLRPPPSRSVGAGSAWPLRPHGNSHVRSVLFQIPFLFRVQATFSLMKIARFSYYEISVKHVSEFPAALAEQ